MKLSRKLLSPLIFSIVYILFFQLVLFTIETSLPRGDYAGIAWFILAFGAWVLFVMPVHCFIYGKKLPDGKFKYLFALYNCVLLTFFHLMFFTLDGDSFIILVVLFGWSLLWTLIPQIKIRRRVDE